MPCLLQRSLNSSSSYRPSCPSRSHLISSWRLSANCYPHRSQPEPPTPNRQFRCPEADTYCGQRHTSSLLRGVAQRDAPALGLRRRESGLEAGKFRPRVLRHTYCAARPQTLDHVRVVAGSAGRLGTHCSLGTVPKAATTLLRGTFRAEAKRLSTIVPPRGVARASPAGRPVRGAPVGPVITVSSEQESTNPGADGLGRAVLHVPGLFPVQAA